MQLLIKNEAALCYAHHIKQSPRCIQGGRCDAEQYLQYDHICIKLLSDKSTRETTKRWLPAERGAGELGAGVHPHPWVVFKFADTCS